MPRQAAFAAIVRALDQPAFNKTAEGVVESALRFQVAPRRRAGFQSAQALQPGRATQAAHGVLLVHRLAHQNNGVTFVLEPLRGDLLRLVDQSDHGHGRSRIDGAVRTLIVEAAIAAGDGALKCRQASARRGRILSIARTTPGCADWRNSNCPLCPGDGTGAGQIAGRLRHGNLGALVRIQIDVGRVAIHRQRDVFLHDRPWCGPLRERVALDADDGGV